MNSVRSLYIHFPFCRHLCNYCDFYKKIPVEKDVEEFQLLFEKMVGRHKDLLKQNHFDMGELETLYIGGGTPSLWGSNGAQFLKSLFEKEKISLASQGEFTLEVNPGTYTEEGIQKWREFGINRFSLGVQSLRSDYLKVLDRVHSLEDVFKTLSYFNELKVEFSVDFMLGLPWSEDKKRDIIAELNQILEFSPNHISLYILTAKKSYPHKDYLPEEDFLEKEYLLVAEHLKSLGFNHYEVSNFAKPGKESCHNLKYWQGESVAALGPSAVGFLKEVNLRYKWKTSSAQFQPEVLDEEAKALEKLYLGLRIQEGIIKNEHFSEEELTKLEPLFENWHRDSLASLTNERVVLTSRGLLILDGLMEQIFSALKSL